MNRVNGRNRGSGAVALSAITGMSTDHAARWIARKSQSTDEPRFRIREVPDFAMVRYLFEHGYGTENPVREVFAEGFVFPGYRSQNRRGTTSGKCGAMNPTLRHHGRSLPAAALI